MLFEKQKICITKIPLQNLVCFYSKYHKSLIMSEVFYKKKKSYYSTARPYLEYIMFVCDLEFTAN